MEEGLRPDPSDLSKKKPHPKLELSTAGPVPRHNYLSFATAGDQVRRPGSEPRFGARALKAL
jgi:hypothetical protein